jgi:ribosomal protein S27AE
MAEKKDAKKKTFKEYKPGRMCPKCGKRMAEHNNRLACGFCSYTEFRGAKA